jgi:hypothetical protein
MADGQISDAFSNLIGAYVVRWKTVEVVQIESVESLAEPQGGPTFNRITKTTLPVGPRFEAPCWQVYPSAESRPSGLATTWIHNCQSCFRTFHGEMGETHGESLRDLQPKARKPIDRSCR